MKDSNLRDASADDKQSITSLFAERLRHWRRERGLSLKALAEKIGVSESTIVGYEQARKTPGIDKLMALATALNCPVTDLLGEAGSPEIAQEELQRQLTTAVTVARIAGCDCSLATPAEGYITIIPPPRISRNTDGEIITEAPVPVIMAESAFVSVFDAITYSVLVHSPDLREFVTNVLRQM